MSGRLEESDLEEALRLLIDLTNTDPTDADAARRVLVARRTSGTAEATDHEVVAVCHAAHEISKAALAHPNSDPASDHSETLNAVLRGLRLTPQMVAHDGLAPHLHWTESDQPYTQQVEADLAMALAIAITLGTSTRIRRCSAENCDRLIYDQTKNRSTRYCPDRECGNRTRQQRHRDRQAS